MPLQPGRKLGPYEILALIGAGGMGEVYEAKDTRLNRTVAVKVLPPELSSDAERRGRFEREARAASALNHPNITTVYDIGQDGDTRYIVMELVVGRTLRELVGDGPLTTKNIVRLATQVAEGLAKAHAAGIAHRDLKPENLMVTDDGLVKILDFGLAKLMSPSTDADSEIDTVPKATQQGALLGTVQYMSPEQAASRPIDYRSDQFSFGLILYEMATARIAFKKETIPQTLAAIIEDDPEPIRKLNTEISFQLSEIVERCLAKDPNERYDSTAEMARELMAVSETSPTSLTRQRILSTAAGLKCVGCGHENTAGAEFCLQCGAKLENLCPQCEKVLPPSARFCDNCGQPLADTEPSKSARESPPHEGERRQATVLFSELSGYTALSERLDPEEVQGIMSRIKTEAVKIVESHGGIVNQFVGDAVLTLFGIPTTHEDDPHRAVRASLELHELVRDISPEVEEKTGARLRMHSGINTGLIVTQLRDDRDGRYGITGDAVNTGTRLAAEAREDEILLGPETHRQIVPFFETEAVEPVVMKGKTEPVIPHRVVGVSTVQSRLEALEPQGFTAFTGREGELATLNRCLEKVVAGNGQFVSVVGEAGVGKSRLLVEFRHGLDGDSITVLQARCQSYGAYTPYQPFINALRQGLSLEEEDTPEELSRKAVANVRAIDEALEEYIPLYLHLLSLESKEHPVMKALQGPDLAVAFRDALAALFTLYTRSRPMVLVLEDWHWADEASNAALNHLLGVIPSYPLLVAVLYRPEYEAGWGNPGHHTPIALHALDGRNSEAVVKAVLEVEALPDGLATLIHGRTGGNPFFIEEVCETLKEEGSLTVENGKASLTRSLEQLTLPDTVQAVIRARLDRLDRYARETLGLASVIGREFSRRILERICESTVQARLSSSLETLKTLELIQQVRLVPEAAYTFKHVLTQEVTYATLLLQKRKELHARVARAIEELYANHLEEHLEALAYQYDHGEEWDKAVEFQIKAGMKARQKFDLGTARLYFDRAREVLRKEAPDVSWQDRFESVLRQKRVPD